MAESNKNIGPIEEQEIKTEANINEPMEKKWWRERGAIEKERVNKWREKQAKENPSYSHKLSKSNSNGDEQTTKEIVVEKKFDNPSLTDNKKVELQEATLFAATGSANQHYARMLINETISGFSRNKNNDANTIVETLNIVHATLVSLNPQDPIEGMLCSRLLVLHNQSMHFLSRSANPEQTNVGVDININRSTKLMRVYNETLEALNRHRRKGKQKIIVQHVNVGNGGQAVVAGELHRGGDNEKK